MRVTLPFLPRVLLATMLLLGPLGGCTKDSGDDDGGASGSVDEQNVSSTLSLKQVEDSLLTDENGEATVVFNLESGVVSARLEGFSSQGQLKAVSVRTPGGSIISENSLAAEFSGAGNGSSNITSIALPLTGGELTSGEYQVLFRLSGIEGDLGNAFESITTQIFTRKDADLSKGTAKVNLVYIGALGGSTNLKDEMRDIIAESRGNFARANVSLDIRSYDLSGPETCPDPKTHPALYEEIANQVRDESVTILVCSDAEGFKSPEEDLTVRPRGLQTVTNSSRSISVFALKQIAGNDTRFNFEGEGEDQVVDDEFQLAVEELSQLIAHGLGLGHNVEIEGDRVVGADNISDTSACASLVDCREEKDVRENLMFPYPLEIPDEGDKTYERSRISSGQAAVMQRSILVD